MSRISQLTALTAVDRADLLATVDVSDTTQSAAGSTKRVSITSVFEAMGGAAIAQGVLTPVSGDPTGNSSSASTLYYTPYTGNRIALWDGTNYSPVSFSETSLSLSGLTTGTLYDVFGYISGGALTLETLAWSSATARATSLAGFPQYKTGDQTRRYLGTIRATGTTTTASDRQKRFIWNNNNRVLKEMFSNETGTSHAYTTASWREWNNSTAYRLEYIQGLVEESVTVQLVGKFSGSAESRLGLGFNTVATSSVPEGVFVSTALAGASISTTLRRGVDAVLGYNYIAPMQFGSASGNFDKIHMAGTIMC